MLVQMSKPVLVLDTAVVLMQVPMDFSRQSLVDDNSSSGRTKQSVWRGVFEIVIFDCVILRYIYEYIDSKHVQKDCIPIVVPR